MRFSEDHYFRLNGDVRVTALHRFMTEAGWTRVKDLLIGMRKNWAVPDGQPALACGLQRMVWRLRRIE